MTDNVAMPSRLYSTRRNRITTIDAAWRLAEAELPPGWSIIELCFMPPMGTYTACWYASAGNPDKPDGEHAEGQDESPI